MTDEVQDVEVIEDARTGEIIPKGSPEQLRPGILAQININQVGTLEVSEKALEVINEPLDPKDVQIRPDGLVYLPWTWYNKKLNRAFGVLQWGLIPQGSPQVKEMGNSTLIVWLNWLVVKGIPVSMAGGETSYQPSNYTMSYGDAIEGARSNSLARNCKNLGMAIELWDADWVKNWKNKYAETYKNDKGKTLWRKRSLKPQNTPTSPSTIPSDDHQNDSKASENVETGNEPLETPETVVEEFSVGELKIAERVVAIKEVLENKKTIPEIMKVINSLDKSKKFSLAQVEEILKGQTK